LLSKKHEKVIEETTKTRSKQKESIISSKNQNKFNRVDSSVTNTIKSKKKQEKKVYENSIDFDNSISLIVAEYENKINKMVNHNQDQTKMKMLHDELLKKSKSELLKN